MLKNAYILEKDVKNLLRVGLRSQTPVSLQQLGVPPPDPRVVTPAGLLLSKKNKFCIFQIFAAIFHLKLCSFCWQGAQEYFLPQGAGYPSYATDFSIYANIAVLPYWRCVAVSASD